MEQSIPDLDLGQIAASGQCFTWERTPGGRYAFLSGDRYVEAAQEGERFSFSCTETEFEETWRSYFDLDADYGAIKRGADRADPYLTSAVAFGGGVRILRQDLWTVMVSFLISQNNNITRIGRSVRGLRETYGRRLSAPGTEAGCYWTFPTPEELTGAGAEDLKRLGLGYRAEYLAVLAHQLRDGGLGELRGRLETADDGEAAALLRTLRGVGPKVADCISLFGLHRIDRFPVDTHIKKILDREYPNGFPMERYAGFLGVIQQYLFYYDLHGPKRGR